MASIQIPNLPAVVGLSGEELFESVQSNTSVKISLSQIIAATVPNTPTTLPLPVYMGGTGLTTYTIGDILYASATQTLSKLADVATGNALISGGVGVAPSYGKIGLTTHVSGILPVSSGGTGQGNSLTQYGAIYADTTTSMASTGAGTATQVIHGGATPSFSAVSLTADVSGVLPISNGGTNLTAYTTGDIVAATASNVLSTIPDVATDNVLLSGGVGALPAYGKVTLTGHVSGILPPANGGTGNSSYTTGDILYASSPTALSKLADVATGNVLLAGGPTYGKVDLATTVSGTLPVSTGGTGSASNLTQYGLVYGGTTTSMATTGSGTSTQVLHGNAAGAPTFGSVVLGTDITATFTLAQGGTGVTSGSSSIAASLAAAVLMGYTTTATSGGATTLDNTSSQYQLFTGTLTQTVRLPNTSTLTTGWTFHIVNNSTGDLTVNASPPSLVTTVPAQMTLMVTCISTSGTGSTDWEYGFTDFGSVTGTGGKVLATSPTITTPILSGNIGAGGAAYGTSGQVLTSGGVGSNLAWADKAPARTIFTSSGTWTKPANAKLVLVRVWGAGGGGAGGQVGAVSTNKFGGQGGGGGGYFEKYFYPSALSATVTVTVGTAGTGGASLTAGVAGGSSSFGAYVVAGGGAGGAPSGGSTSNTGDAQAAGTGASTLTTIVLTGGAASSAAYYGGGGGSAATAIGGASQFGGGGGGGGGYETAANVLNNAASGGQSNYNTGVGAGGTSVAGAPTAGGAATGAGCGGGGGGSATTTNAAAGGAGAFPGGGGGGGGTTRTGFLGGAGGAGAAGYVEVFTW